jgi:hypothetical protein
VSAPERRTLKGVAWPFQVYAVEGRPDMFYAQGDPLGPRGVLLTVVSTMIRNGQRIGRTEDGRQVMLGGPTSKLWIFTGGGR